MKNESIKDKELWMDKLKEKLENYSEPMPTSRWEQLEKEMIPPSVPRRTIYPYRRWAISVAAVLLVAVSSISLYFLNTPVAEEMRRTSIPTLVSGPDVLPESGPSENKSARIEPSHPVHRVVAQVRQTVERQGLELSEPLKIAVTGEDLQVAQEKNKDVAKSESEDKTVRNQESKEQREQPTSRQVRRPSRSDKLHIPSRSVLKRRKWSMGVAVGNAGGGSGNFVNEGSSHGFPQRLNIMDFSDALVKVPENQTVYFQNGLPYLQNKSEIIDVKHRQPITVGLTVRKGLKKGFSVETGLMYTLLSSDITLNGSNKSIDQKLHYIGIPLRANWNFVEKNRFILYVSAGGQIEKCVYGNQGNEKLTVKPWQLSVTGAVGAQFNATKHLGIYVEPGVAYFFDDDSDVKTIRKENPFNFNLQAGVRFTY